MTTQFHPCKRESLPKDVPSHCIVQIPSGTAARFEQAALPLAARWPQERLHERVTWQGVRDEFRTAVSPETYDSLLTRIEAAAERAPYFVIIRGLSRRAPTHLLVALTTGLGDLVFPDRGSQTCAVDLIRPGTDFATPEWGVNNEALHTDSTMWHLPNRYTCLFTAVADPSGGSTRLLDLDALEERLAGTPLIELLHTRPLPWGLDDPSGDFDWRPVIHGGTIRWARFSIGRGKHGTRVELEPEIECALDEFLAFLADSDDAFLIDLAAGDLLVTDNTRLLHGRTQVADPARSERLLFRTRIGHAS